MNWKALSVIFALALIAAIVYVSDPAKVAVLLLSLRPEYAAAMLAITVVNAGIRTVRWRYLLSKVDVNVDFITAMKILVTSVGISNLTPGKSGDPIRSVLLKKASGVSMGTTLPSIIIERALDIIAMIIISFVGLFFLSANSQVTAWMEAAVAIYVAALAVALIILSSETRTKQVFRLLFRILSFIPKIKSFEHKLDGFASDVHKSFLLYGKKRIMAYTCVMSIIIWAAEGLTLWLAFSALGLSVPLAAAITIVSAGTLISVLTFLPGGLGSGELITVIFFTTLTTLTLADVTAVALLTRLLSFWLYVAAAAVLAGTMKYEHKI